MGRRQPRQAGQALSAAPSWPAGRHRADGHAAGLTALGLDHRAGAQHQRRLQHGLIGGRETHVLRTDLIAPIPELLRRHAAARGDKCAYRDAHRSVTYAALYERTAKFAGHLADNGIAVGDTVAIFLPNSVEWAEACFAIARAGAMSVPIS